MQKNGQRGGIRGEHDEFGLYRSVSIGLMVSSGSDRTIPRFKVLVASLAPFLICLLLYVSKLLDVEIFVARCARKPG
jgi:hypothetical protein